MKVHQSKLAPEQNKRVTYNGKEGVISGVYDYPALRDNGFDELGKVAIVDFEKPQPHFLVILLSDIE